MFLSIPTVKIYITMETLSLSSEISSFVSLNKALHASGAGQRRNVRLGELGKKTLCS